MHRKRHKLRLMVSNESNVLTYLILNCPQFTEENYSKPSYAPVSTDSTKIYSNLFFYCEVNNERIISCMDTAYRACA